MSDARRKPAVFLDRDGTIAEEMGYLNHITRFQLYPFAALAIRRLNEAGLPVMVVTNQSGVARGFFPEELIHRVHQQMRENLAACGASVDGIYYCPHDLKTGCECRKPRLGMLERAAREHNINLAGAYVVSDRLADLEMTRASQLAGGRGILVMTGYGRGEFEWNRTRPEFSGRGLPDLAVENLAEAVDAILREVE